MHTYARARLRGKPSSGTGFPATGRGVRSKPNFSDMIKADIYADNWFAIYINGKLVAVDPIDFIPHNEVTIDLLA